jgi:eukaryotic-like serine/threonine-protein kinase
MAGSQEVPDMLDRYEIECELEAPAASALYRAWDIRTARKVVIKLTPIVVSETSATPKKRARGEPAAHLVHPDIAVVHDAGLSGPLQCAVMELVPGADLRAHVMPSRLLPLQTVLSLAARVGDALHYAHEQGVVHGDVKPGNIVFDAASDTVKLVDFTCVDPKCECSRTGTFRYMSPERLRGAPASPLSDQFALGVTLYQLACGCAPFSGASRPQIAYRTAYGLHTPIREHDAALPARLSRILGKALAKDPGKRYSSTGLFAAAIRELHIALQRQSACAM